MNNLLASLAEIIIGLSFFNPLVTDATVTSPPAYISPQSAYSHKHLKLNLLVRLKGCLSPFNTIKLYAKKKKITLI